MIEGLSHITLVVEEKFFVVGGVWVAIMEGKKLLERSYGHVAFKVPETELDGYVDRVRALASS